jgi:hypothetical protein
MKVFTLSTAVLYALMASPIQSMDVGSAMDFSTLLGTPEPNVGTIKMIPAPKQLPQGVIMLGAMDLLKRPDAALITKQNVVKRNKVSITDSTIVLNEKDKSMLLKAIAQAIVDGNVQVRSATLKVENPPGKKNVRETHEATLKDKGASAVQQQQQQKPQQQQQQQQPMVNAAYRYGFLYPSKDGKTFLFGWRYPLNYWRMYGDWLYAAEDCKMNRVLGDFFYC